MEVKVNLAEDIIKLKKAKNAIIMSHYYQIPQIQEIADFVGDSLALAQKASTIDADIIVLCGVHFMGETAKIICPDKKVLVPDLSAGCSLADSCKAEDLLEWKKNNPEYKVISYVNTSAAVKALTDIVVTSSNALKIINMLPKEEKILFGPDYNLGNYINSITGRNMQLWNGACHVHSRFSLSALLELKKQHPAAKVLAHPECKKTLLELSDFVGSTQAILNYVIKSEDTEFIVLTESGILHKMKEACPDKTFIVVPPEISEEKIGGKISTCMCNECEYMRLNTLQKLYDCLKYEKNEIIVDEQIMQRAYIPIKKMLEMSK